MRLILCLLICGLIYCAPPFPIKCWVGLLGNGAEPDLRECPAGTLCCMSFKQGNSMVHGFNCSSNEKGCNYIDHPGSNTPGFVSGIPVRDPQCVGDSAFTNSNFPGACWGSYCRGPSLPCQPPNMCYVGQSYYNGSAVAGQQKPTLTSCSAAEKCCSNRVYQTEQRLVYSCSANCDIIAGRDVNHEVLGPDTDSSIRHTCRSFFYNSCTYPWIEPTEQTSCYVGQSYHNGTEIAGKPKPTLTTCSASQKCCTNRAYLSEEKQTLVYSCSENCGVLGDNQITGEFLGPATNSSIRFTCRGSNHWCTYPRPS